MTFSPIILSYKNGQNKKIFWEGKDPKTITVFDSS
jgi:hypothetical protein